MLRISGIGLLTASKEPLQEHKDHPIYNRVAMLRITNIGMFTAIKEPTQEHKDHPSYDWRQLLRITDIGFFSASAVGQRQQRVRIVQTNKEVTE